MRALKRDSKGYFIEVEGMLPNQPLGELRTDEERAEAIRNAAAFTRVYIDPNYL